MDATECRTVVRSMDTARVSGNPGEARASLTELVLAARAGDQSAWNEIVDRFSRLLWSVARSHRLDEPLAVDVVQCTWLRLVESLDRIHEPEALAGWLVTTARRESLRVLTARGREVLDNEPPDRWDPADELDVHLLTDERDAVLWRCFGTLPERCQSLLRVLVSPECPPYAVVAQEFGMPVGSIGPTRGRCLGQLRDRLTTSGYDFGTLGGGLR